MPDSPAPQNCDSVEINGSQFQIPAWVQWLAQDEDGAWWGYEATPNQQHNGWYENEVGRIVKLCDAEPNNDWQTTLLRLR